MYIHDINTWCIRSMETTIYIIVVSDTIYQDPSKDISGKKAVEILRNKGFNIIKLEYMPNNYREIIRKVIDVSSNADIAVFIGGTGPSPRDITIDVIESMAWRKLPGFGELFRRISYEVNGINAILSRSELYIMSSGKIIVVLPGSPKAIEIGLDILSRVINHLVKEIKRFEGEHKT